MVTHLVITVKKLFQFAVLHKNEGERYKEIRVIEISPSLLGLKNFRIR